MAKVFDVAKYILEKQGQMTAMKLQKLVYYSQAWSLVWDEKPLFNARIEAWANGPVCPNLYSIHRGMFRVGQNDILGDSSNLEEYQRQTIDEVLNFYGNESSQWLSDLTHKEEPWRQARKGYEPGDICSNEITHASMAEYYGSL